MRLKLNDNIKTAIVILVSCLVIGIMMIWFILGFDALMQYIFGDMFESSDYEALGLILYVAILIYFLKNLFK